LQSDATRRNKNKFRHIKQAEKCRYGSGVSAVEKDVEGERIWIEYKTETEEEIARVNRAQLQKVNNTLLREHPLQALLGMPSKKPTRILHLNTSL